DPARGVVRACDGRADLPIEGGLPIAEAHQNAPAEDAGDELVLPHRGPCATRRGWALVLAGIDRRAGPEDRLIRARRVDEIRLEILPDELDPVVPVNLRQ